MSNTPSTWRFIPLIPASGQLQMAIDSWLLQQHRLGNHPPTLRFYTWEPVAISLGYHQHRWPQFWHNLTWQGKPIDLVRRPTGGRAVLHQGDLTYAVITSGLPTRRIEAYQTICQFLIQGWHSLGFELHYGSAGRGYIHNPNCFGTATAADLVLSDGSKLIGSAQLRRDRAILQHGSIRLDLDLDLERQVFGLESTLLEPLESRPSQIQSSHETPHDINTGQQILKERKKRQFENKIESQDRLRLQSIPIEKIITTLVDSARLCFNVEFRVEPLSKVEWQTIRALEQEISVPV